MLRWPTNAPPSATQSTPATPPVSQNAGQPNRMCRCSVTEKADLTPTRASVPLARRRRRRSDGEGHGPRVVEVRPGAVVLRRLGQTADLEMRIADARLAGDVEGRGPRPVGVERKLPPEHGTVVSGADPARVDQLDVRHDR